MSPEMKDNLAVVCAQVDKKYGKGSVMKLTDKVSYDPDQAINSGSISLDMALGIGGYKKGRIVEIYGPESCIAFGSFIQYEVWQGEKRINHKGGRIDRLYERFTGEIVKTTPKQGKHLQKENCDFYVKSINDEGMVVRNKVLDVVKTGKKKCYKVETATGEILFSTEDHKFMTPNGFRPLKDLSPGDTLFVHNGTKTKGRKEYLKRPEVYVKYHPNLPIKKVKDSKTGKEYKYYRAQKSRMIYEAYINNMSYEDYIKFLNSATFHEILSLNFIDTNLHVHHKDEDFNNNNIDNLELVNPSVHGCLHAKDRIKNLSFVVVPSEIINITEAGEHDTYDIKCAYPYNNYIAEGIVVHNSGKTTLCLHAVANIQAKGKEVLYIDAEHSLDPQYAQFLGVDLDKMLIAQPDYGEQALDLVDTFVRSGEIGLVIVDSVAALVPKKELEGDMGDSHVGLQARMMSQAMRKIAGQCNHTECTVIFVNQIRMKIGVMFGCFQYNTRVLLSDGTTEKIGKIVNQKLPVEVMSMNTKTNEIIPKKVINWFDNGNAECFLKIKTTAPSSNGYSIFETTENHSMIVWDGEEFVERAAGTLQPGDELVSHFQEQELEHAKDIIVGSVLGDGSLRQIGRHTTSLRLGHNNSQYDYLRWKSKLLTGAYSFTKEEHAKNNSTKLASSPDYRLELLRQQAYGDKTKKFNNNWRDFCNCGPLAAAIWYMDDGTFSGTYEKWGHGKAEICAKSMTQEMREAAADWLEELCGARPTVTHRSLLFSGERTNKFHKMIAKYVPTSMEYKIHPKLRQQEKWEPHSELLTISGPVLVRVESVEKVTGLRSMKKFDIEVEGNHNYFVGGPAGICVHNSPETTTGGNALKFYASQRLDIRRIGNLKRGDEIIGNKTKVTVVKNKVGPPKKVVEFNILFGRGIDTDQELLDLAIMDRIIEKSGAWYKYQGTSIAQGEVNAIQWLNENPDTKKEIFNEVKENRGIE